MPADSSSEFRNGNQIEWVAEVGVVSEGERARLAVVEAPPEQGDGGNEQESRDENGKRKKSERGTPPTALDRGGRACDVPHGWRTHALAPRVEDRSYELTTIFQPVPRVSWRL